MPVCAEDDCASPAAVRIYAPGDAPRDVCVPHARALAHQPGVVAEPLDGADDHWP